MEISFIIIARSREKLLVNCDWLATLIKTQNLSAEIITSIGENPSRQRNVASQKAQGEWLYFLDDDSTLDRQSVEQFYLCKKQYPQALIFGGPSLLGLSQGVPWQEAVELVFTSDFGVGPIKSRYLAVGPTRSTTEKELILCNLIVNKEFFLKSGGFNEDLYPNEENEFLSRIDKQALKIYSPLIIVYRNHRKTIWSFLLQMISYGKGRTKHFLFARNYGDYVYFIPLIALLMASMLTIYYMNAETVLVLGGLYLAIILPTCLIQFFYRKNMTQFLYSILVFAVCHSGYALGLALGFFSMKKNRKNGVVVTKELVH